METIFKKFEDLKVLVVGDIILDRYYFTDVERISPEAPIPVARYSNKKEILGGAANVALNVSKLGVKTYLVGAIGADDNGVSFRNLINANGIDFLPIFFDMKTITKIRIVSKGHQLVRLDFEDKFEDGELDSKKIILEIEKIIDEVDLVIVSDYRKGLMSKAVINYLKNLKKYVSIDTKPGVFMNFEGFNFIKPNFKEAIGIAGKLGFKDEISNEDEDISKLGRFLVKKLNSNLLITRGEKGVSFIGKDGEVFHKATDVSEVIDVTGAGDTSIVIFSLLDFLGMDKEESLEVLNVAAKLTISHFGNYAPEVFEILSELKLIAETNLLDERSLNSIVAKLKDKNKKIVFTNGCFDILHRGHISYLNKAKSYGDVLIVGINSDESVKKLKGEKRPIIDEISRAELVGNLKAVDYVCIFNDLTPERLISKIKPDVHVKGGDYAIEDLPEAKVVKEFGGEVKLIKYEEGYSTTQIIENIIRNEKE